MTDSLHVFAITAPEGLRHTHLTRAEGLAADLPPLTDWLGAEVDTDQIELFPVRDLGDMALSDYITMAFAPEPIAPDSLRRINAIKGHVLLVPESALSEEPAPTADARLVASLPLARADHAASLPKADVTPMPRPPAPQPPRQRIGSGALWAIAGLGLLLLLVLLVL
ncbi:hypothetical protein [Roseicyclus marinus]|uniref:hypothetical protein n=1 Tax=Roseicyclus marinus TaxID=2161673 RepID=UPI00240E9D4F|nr:hypothetical protein [Roseicyclus marinus]MDG3041103.1 hypothetical protein [Roseicyclus marinus]